MANLKREAMGQYNYVVGSNVIVSDKTKKEIKKIKAKLDLQNDASVCLVEGDLEEMLKYKAPKAPQMFESKYATDFRPPPDQNIIYRKNPFREEHYSQYPQGLTANVVYKTTKRQSIPRPQSDSKNMRKASDIKPQRAGTAPTKEKVRQEEVARHKDHEEARGLTPFIRAMVNARDNWKHKKEKSFDPMNPQKPSQERETFPYGSYLEGEQEGIVQRAEVVENRPKISARPNRSQSVASSVSSYSSKSSEKNSSIGLRATSSASGSIRSQIDVDGITVKPTLTIIEEEDEPEGELIKLPKKEEGATIYPDGTVEVTVKPMPLKPKQMQVNVMKARRSPDRRFYRSKKRQTPNEMNQYKKMRGRTFFKPLEQAIPEKDFVDHQVKYQPERQLLQDVRWKVRQEMKDIRNENNMKLVDRFGKRVELIQEENKQRRGYPTYAGRQPVSIYKVADIHGSHPPENALKVDYPIRRRVTPSLGSVQRARNLSTHANVWNQACAPPHWGPQKVNNNYFLPKLSHNINSNFELVR